MSDRARLRLPGREGEEEPRLRVTIHLPAAGDSFAAATTALTRALPDLELVRDDDPAPWPGDELREALARLVDYAAAALEDEVQDEDLREGLESALREARAALELQRSRM